ncbi:MAG: hypothetical protein Q4E07_06245 [Eubacteriales bacterium]|nr:hypothetical protein [Eubacteriales bacterium]
MAKEHYELLALFMRYWFVFLTAMIVWRAVRQMARERHQHKRILKSLPDAGLVGEIVDTKTSEAYPLPREGFISSKSFADIRLKNLKKGTTLHFEFIEKKGIQLSGVGRSSSALADGTPVKNKPYALHGTYLEIGGYVLRFRLFEGLNVPNRVQKRKQTVDVQSVKEYSPTLENTWVYAIEPPQYEVDNNIKSELEYTVPQNIDYAVQDIEMQVYEEESPEVLYQDGAYFKPIGEEYYQQENNIDYSDGEEYFETQNGEQENG